MLTFTQKIIGVCILFLAVAGAFAWQRSKFNRLQEQYHTIALKSANDSARLDSTKTIIFSVRDSAKFLGDSIRAVTRLAVQQQQGKDILDATLKQVRTAITSLEAQVKVLAVTSHSTSPVLTDSSDTRSATFMVDSTPYHVRADVSLPKTGAGTIGLGVHLDPARIAVRSGCEERANDNGIRMARVSLTGPTWLTLNVAAAEQDDQVCNHVAPSTIPWISWKSLMVGAGWTMNGTGSGPGVFVGGGLRIGH